MRQRSRTHRVLVTAILLASLLVPAAAANAGDGATPFVDIENSFATEQIEQLFAMEITSGTSPNTFSPRDPVTREQMAAFLARFFESLTGDTCTPSTTTFGDVAATSYAFDAIGCLYGLGITRGTSATTYTPSAAVTREQMALFLARFYETLSDDACPSGVPPFNDVSPSLGGADAIGCIYALDITTGTSPTTYSPGSIVTREQMAAFLIRLDTAIASTDDPDAPGEPDAPDDPETQITCCNEGRAGFNVTANSSWDIYTSGGYWSWFDDHVDRATVFAPYWDSRIDDFAASWAYRNTYGISTNTSSDSRSVDHPEWVLREADGSPTYIPFGCGGGCAHFAGDVGNPAYRADYIAMVQGLVDEGYTGLFLDDVNFAWRFGDNSGDDAFPVDPRTGSALTLQNWQQYLAEFLEAIRDEFPQIEIVHNVIWYADSPSLTDPEVDRAIAAADFLSLERGVNDDGLTGGTGTFAVRTFMENVDRAHSLGTNVIFVDRSATGADEQRYNLAALLLVNDGGDLVSTDNLSMGSPAGWWSEFDVDLGHTLGDRWTADGLILREFTDGMVILNEPGNGDRTYTLDEPLRDPSGTWITSVTLSAKQATILTRS